MLLIHFKLLFVVAVWGFGWPAGRVIAQDIAPFVASWLRYIIAVLLSSLFTSDFPASGWYQLRDEWKRIAWIGFFSTCLYQAFFMIGMKYTAAGDASLMITFNPFFTALLAIVFLKEDNALAPRVRYWIGTKWCSRVILLFSKCRHSFL